MTTILLAFLAMLVIVTAMAIGVLFGREPISGSCGGMQRLGLAGVTSECEICGGNPERCSSSQESSPVQSERVNDLAREVPTHGTAQKEPVA